MPQSGTENTGKEPTNSTTSGNVTLFWGGFSSLKLENWAKKSHPSGDKRGSGDKS